MARAVRAGSARRPCGLARPARLGPGRRPARRGGAGGDPSARVGSSRRRGCSSCAPGWPRGVATAGRASRPSSRADRARAGRCHGRRAAGRPGRAGRRAGATRRAEAPQGGDRRRARALSALDQHARPDAAHAAELARAAEASGRRFDARAWWRLAARRDPIHRSRGRRPRSLAWPRPSRRPSTARGRSPTCSGRFGRREEAKTRGRPAL